MSSERGARPGITPRAQSYHYALVHDGLTAAGVADAGVWDLDPAAT